MKTVYFVLSLGLVIRLLLSPLPGFKPDVDAWVAWADRLSNLGFASFYSSQVWTNYTPGFLYLLNLLSQARSILQLSFDSLYILVKLPSIFAEVLLGLLVYQEAKKTWSLKWATLLALAIILNPAFIFNSAIWGQIDGLLTLFLYLSLYFLKRQKIILSSLSYALSLMIKPQAVAVLPVLFTTMVHSVNLKRILSLIGPFVFVILLLSYPFFPQQPLTGVINLTISMSNDYQSTSLFAYNFWGIFGFWQSDSAYFGITTLKNWGVLFLGTFWAVTGLFYLKKPFGLYSLAALGLLAFYFLPTRVHERYLYPALVFLLLAIMETRNLRLFKWQIILTLIHLLNLYFVYIYYNHFYLNLSSPLYNNILYSSLLNTGHILSLLSTLVFIIISYTVLSYAHIKKDS